MIGKNHLTIFLLQHNACHHSIMRRDRENQNQLVDQQLLQYTAIDFGEIRQKQWRITP